MTQERRSRTRVALEHEITVTIGGHAIKVKSWDLSLRGMKCNNDPAFKPDTPCEVKIVLSPEIDIKIKGEILRITEDYTAVFFSDIEEESFHYLKSLLQHNTNKPDAIEDELVNPVKKPTL
jgi:hypothetical protein